MRSSSISLKTVPLIWLGFRATQLNTGMRNLVLMGFLIFTAGDSTRRIPEKLPGSVAGQLPRWEWHMEKSWANHIPLECWKDVTASGGRGMPALSRTAPTPGLCKPPTGKSGMDWNSQALSKLHGKGGEWHKQATRREKKPHSQGFGTWDLGKLLSRFEFQGQKG